MNCMELKTPLYDCHLAAGGKMVPFAGYLLPVQYEKSGIIAEHMAVREKAGLFDVSHMGEFFLSGSDALNTLNHLLCNNYTTLQDGAVRYSPLCNETGGILDDLLVYRIRENGYFIVVNAANRHKDFCWMQNHLCGDASLEDRSDSIAQLALQGPLAQQILQRLVSDPLPQKYYTFIERLSVSGIPCLVSRTGYTGEDGFELYCAPESAPALWNALLSAGADDGLIPCALGARDTLRLEAAMPLYGHEMDETVTPLETGLSYFVKLEKPEFIGKEALLAQTPQRGRIGVRITGRGIAREGCAVYDGETRIGQITSGTFCPYLKAAVGMALLNTAYAEPGHTVEVDVRGRRIAAETVALPFYKRKK